MADRAPDGHHPTAGFIAPADPRWAETLRRARHDVYHLPAYAVLSGREEGGRPAAFYAESGGAAFLVPLLIRPLPPELEAPSHWGDASSPYGYPTPIVAGTPGPGDVRRFLELFVLTARAAGIVSAFIRLHPLVSLALDAPPRDMVTVTHGQTVYIDLEVSADALVRQTRVNHRRDIQRLREAGFRVLVDDWSLYPEFTRVYARTMERLDAAPTYRWPPRYFAGLRASLDGHLHLFVVLSPRDEVASVGLFTEIGGLVQYHLGGTDDRYVAEAPSKLMLAAVCAWARERGHRLFHLGGGLGGRADALLHFKAGFSWLRATFSTCRIVTDQARYEALVRRRLAETEGVPPPADGFFPAYRAPWGEAEPARPRMEHDPLTTRRLAARELP